MPPIYVVFAAALVVASVFTLVWALGSQRNVEGVQMNLGRGGFVRDSRQIALSASARDRILGPVVQGIARRARRRSSEESTGRIQRSLELSGLYHEGWTVERMLVIRFAALVVGLAGAIFFLLQGGGGSTLALAALCGAIGVLGPKAWLDRKADERQRQIEKQLPDIIDQIMVSVEAGLGFDAAIARSAEGRSGPLTDELSRLLQDLQMGVDRQTALERMVERTDVPDLKGFVVAVRQSSRHGLPIAQVLRVQSQELREKRRARIEEKAAQLPVKIVFPLVFCILPSLFVIILGPAGLNIVGSF